MPHSLNPNRDAEVLSSQNPHHLPCAPPSQSWMPEECTAISAASGQQRARTGDACCLLPIWISGTCLADRITDDFLRLPLAFRRHTFYNGTPLTENQATLCVKSRMLLPRKKPRNSPPRHIPSELCILQRRMVFPKETYLAYRDGTSRLKGSALASCFLLQHESLKLLTVTRPWH